jgi:hydroxymethylpyrimidine pyrophosphatase-like HAD family hydrolase
MLHATGLFAYAARSRWLRNVTTTRNDNLSASIQLLSTDFDGTLFAEFEQPPIPDELVALIAGLQADGVKWVINTGREMASLMEALARARIDIQPDFLVLVEREIYVHDGVRYAPVQPWNTACARDHAELFDRIRDAVPRLTEWVNQRFKATVYDDPWSPLCLIAQNNGDADEIHAHLEAFASGVLGLTVVRNDVYARFSHEAYNKGTALAELTRRLGLSSEQVLAAGDHLNDLPMLKAEFARALVCPANAVPSVRETVANLGGFVASQPRGMGVMEGIQHFLKPA